MIERVLSVMNVPGCRVPAEMAQTTTSLPAMPAISDGGSWASPRTMRSRPQFDQVPSRSARFSG